MIGGRNAPSDGGPNTTMEIGSGACASEAPDDSSIPMHARPARYRFMTLLPQTSARLSANCSQSKQTLRKTTIDGGALVIREFGLGDNLQRREIADRERHVRTHHDPFRADDIGEVAQGARILDDGVVVHGGERRIGIAELVLVERIVPAQAADHIRQRRAAMYYDTIVQDTRALRY